MSFFPDGFNPRDPVIGALDLVLIDTPDGEFGFMPGIDGRFVDTLGRVWWGSSLVAADQMEISIGGTAPAGGLTLSYFQDPDAPALAGQIRALGADYVRGRMVRFFVQPLRSMSEFYAPTIAPIQFAARTMTSVSIALAGDLQRTIALGYEGPFVGRESAPNQYYTTADHSDLIGAANNSLRFVPRDDRWPEKLWS